MSDPGELTARSGRGRLGRVGPVVILLVVFGLLGSWWWWRDSTADPLAVLPPIDLANAAADVRRAVDESLAAVRADPRSGSAWGELAMVLRAHGLDRSGDEAFRQAEAHDPDEFRWPYLQGLSLENVDPVEAERYLRRAAELNPELALPRLSLAELMIADGRLDEAERELDAALALDEGNPRAEQGKARVALERGQPAVSLDWARRAVRARPDDRMLHELLAQVHFRLGDTAAAERERLILERMSQEETSDDPYVAQVLLLRRDPTWIALQARTMIEAGRTEQAVEFLGQIIGDHPGDPRFALELARTLGGTGRVDQAAAVLDEAIARQPDAAELRLLRGLVHQQQTQLQLAEQRFREAIERKPDYAEAFAWLARTLRAVGRDDEALEALEQAVRFRPDLADVHGELGSLLLERNRAADAVEHLQFALDASPGDPQLRERLEAARRRRREADE